MALEPIVAALAPAELAKLKSNFANDTQVPQEYDRSLLRVGRIHHGQTSLTTAERSNLRRIFVRLVLSR
jgi:hypothetical protein